MRFAAISLGALAFAASANAQYFSAGWAPGQPKSQTEAAPIPTSVPQKEAPPQRPFSPSGIASLFDITKLLGSAPAVSLFAQLGINITEKLEGAIERSKIWDERVTLITDENYQDLIVNEPLTAKEEQDRTWIIVISVTAGKQDGISKYVDEVFDAAYNATIIAGDLPDVRWGRIDYFNVTAVTTKWAVWHAPYLVILRNRGQTLRFYKPHQLRLKEDAMRTFLEHEDWKTTPPWSTPYSPGGSREYIMDFFAVWLTKIYNAMILIPRWLLFVISGSIASIAINFLHKPAAAAPKPARLQGETTSAPSSKAETSTSAVSPPQANKRKKTKGKNGN